MSIIFVFTGLRLLPLKTSKTNVLGWPKSQFGFFHNSIGKNQNELFGQSNIRIKPWTALYCQLPVPALLVSGSSQALAWLVLGFGPSLPKEACSGLSQNSCTCIGSHSSQRLSICCLECPLPESVLLSCHPLVVGIEDSPQKSLPPELESTLLTILQFHFCASFTLLQAGSILSDLLSAPQILLSFTLAYKNPGLSTFKCLTRNLSSFTVNLKFSFFI